MDVIQKVSISMEGVPDLTPETVDDGHGVNPLVHEPLCLTQQLSCNNDNARCSISYFVVLRLTDFHQDLGSGVVNVDRFQNGRSPARVTRSIRRLS